MNAWLDTTAFTKVHTHTLLFLMFIKNIENTQKEHG